jgi:hypothetical protein
VGVLFRHRDDGSPTGGARCRMLGLVVSVAVLVPLLAGCGAIARAFGHGGETGSETAKLASSWVSDASRLLEESRGVPIREIRPDTSAAGRLSRADDLLSKAPDGDVRVAELATRLRTLRTFYALVGEAQATVYNRWTVASTSVGETAVTALNGYNPGAREKIVEFLTDHGKAVLLDVGCDLAWSRMTSNEQTAVNQLYDNGYRRVIGDEVAGVEKMLPQAVVDAIKGEASETYLKYFAPERFIDWLTYAADLYKKANELTADGKDTIPAPDGVITRALPYYVRLCMLPPR